MKSQPSTLKDLLTVWKHDLYRLNEDNSTEIAGLMVGRLAGNDNWEEFYKNSTISQIFDLAADLELPSDIRINSIAKDSNRFKGWTDIKDLLDNLEQDLK